MSHAMDKQEAAESSQEFGSPFSFVDFQACKFAMETLSDKYCEVSSQLQKELKAIPIKDVESRHKAERMAYNEIDCCMSDLYDEYKTIHPHSIGYLSTTFARLYGPDGL